MTFKATRTATVKYETNYKWDLSQRIGEPGKLYGVTDGSGGLRAVFANKVSAYKWANADAGLSQYNHGPYTVVELDLD